MELILGIVVIIIILLILGIGIDIIIFGFVGLLAVAAAGSELILLYFLVRLLFSKKRSAVFTRIDRQGNRRYDTAFYRTEEEGELPNVFPAEVVMKKRIYDSERTVDLRIDAGKKYVYDSNARATILIGVPLCTLLCIFLTFGINLMLTNGYL